MRRPRNGDTPAPRCLFSACAFPPPDLKASALRPLVIGAPSVSFGARVIAFNLLLIAAEWLLLRGRIRFWAILLLTCLACIFGTCVDGAMFVLFGLEPQPIPRACCG